MIAILAGLVAFVTAINAFIGYESLQSVDKTTKTLDLVTSVAGPAAQKRQAAAVGQILKALQDHETDITVAECHDKAQQLTDLGASLGVKVDTVKLVSDCEDIAKVGGRGMAPPP